MDMIVGERKEEVKDEGGDEVENTRDMRNTG
jgi:hypothetical protein